MFGRLTRLVGPPRQQLAHGPHSRGSGQRVSRVLIAVMLVASGVLASVTSVHVFATRLLPAGSARAVRPVAAALPSGDSLGQPSSVPESSPPALARAARLKNEPGSKGSPRLPVRSGTPSSGLAKKPSPLWRTKTTPPRAGRYGVPLFIDKAPIALAQGLPVSALTPADERSLRVIAAQPTAHWFVDWHDGLEEDVRAVVRRAAAERSIATLVAYNIPHRDCGAYSANGPETEEQYRQWVNAFVAGLGSYRAIVIVEPDALGLTSCLSQVELDERLALLRFAVSRFARQGSWTYLDAGNSAWLPADRAVSLLSQAGVREATGFSLNVAQSRPDSELIAYGDKLSARLGGKHFVIDSSRNGVSPANTDWCNPPDKGLGHRPSATTGTPKLDAYLWIKVPGQSDGSCQGGPPAGDWFASYATMLVRNARLK